MLGLRLAENRFTRMAPDMALRTTRWLIALVVIFSSLSIHPMQPALADTTQVLYETSFEDTEDTTWIAEPSSYDTTQKYTGERSLKYTRTDPAQYVLLRKDVEFEAGRLYEASAFVMTAGLSSTNALEGARVAIQAFNGSTYIGGSFGPGSVSTIWTSLSSGRYIVPAAATRLEVLVYIYNKTTGVAWFDDLTVTETAPKLLRSKLNAPSYRGMLIPGDHDQIDVSMRLTTLGRPASDYTIRIRLLTSTNRVAHETSLAGAATSTWNLSTLRLPAGSYTLRLEVLDSSAGNAIADTEEWPIRKLSRTDPLPLSYIDKYGRLIRDGAPFFPLGFYSTRGDKANIDQLAGKPFNTLLPYSQPSGTNLDYANQQGVKVVYTLKDYFYGTQYCPTSITSVAGEVPAIINTLNSDSDTAASGIQPLRNHPAILSWYVNDELPWYSYEDRLINHQNAVIATDPNHPTYYVDNRSYDGAVYMRTLDVYGPDVYPIHGVAGELLSQPGNYAEQASANLPGRGLWPVAQNFASAQFAGHNSTERAPTRAELRSMSWQFLAAGGKGLLFYSLQNMAYDFDRDGSTADDFAELMGNATAVAEEVSALVPVIMSIETAPALTRPSGEWLDTMIRKHDGKVYVLGVNNGQANNSATFAVPGATSVKVLNENRTLPVDASGTFTDQFNSLAVHIYEVTL